jgi:HSP20 family protein
VIVLAKEHHAVSITRWDPWGDIVSLREAMNNLLEESFVRPRPGISGPGMASSLALDVKETPEKFIVSASVPGVPESDIDISILGDTLRIRGQRKEETEETGEGSRWLLRERRFGLFERTVSLPMAVEADQATASFKDGVLTIELPKAEAARPRTIPVRAGTGDASDQPQPQEIEIESSQPPAEASRE